jgi:molybdopterin-containing oxidoreductase family iron-sulfur binding subunit
MRPRSENRARGRAEELDRRDFIRKAVAAAAAACLPALVRDAQALSWEEFIQQHFYELTREELERRLQRLEREYNERFNRLDFQVRADGPVPHTRFAYALNLSKCIGCRRCVHACVKENNQHRGDPARRDQVEYIRVLEMEKGSLDVEKAVHDYQHPVPAPGKFYMPVQCHHCDNAPCTKVCPIEATWQEVDGVVVVDYEWCIGCRYCEAACPYFARRFNFCEPRLPKDEVNPVTHYLGNRPRSKGVMEKCTFCIQRTRRGFNPACLEVCPTGSRKFGNLLDPQSEIHAIIDRKRVFILKEELATLPSFYYFFD